MNRLLALYKKRYQAMSIEDRVLFIFPFCTTFVLGIFAVLRWSQAQFELALTNTTIVLVMIGIHLLMLLRRAKVARIMFVLFMGGVMIVLVHQNQAQQLNWVYPGTAMLFFAMKPTPALLFATAIVSIIGVLLWKDIDFPRWLQNIVSLYTCIFIVYIFSFSFYRKNARLTKLAIASDKAAKLDSLTSLPNRRSFDLYSELVMSKHRSSKLSASMIIVDIDHFKKVNDTYGHTIGDDILKKTALVLKTTLREHENIYRIGGEEFAVITINTSQKEAMACAERLRVAVENTCYEEIPKLRCTISVGVSSCNGDNVRGWYDRADDALYQAKRNGRNQVIGME